LRIKPEYAKAAANYARLRLAQGDVAGAVDLAARAVLPGSLPDRGERIPAWFKGHIAELRKIARDKAASPRLRGGAIAFLVALRAKGARKMLGGSKSDPGRAEALKVARTMLDLWGIPDTESH
ncbi:MAG TPA: hypothetical protein VM389_13185, partial [Phycisphaerae bacterium]|nr:hypothetical protein [Phycisphaerae bacterium]